VCGAREGIDEPGGGAKDCAAGRGAAEADAAAPDPGVHRWYPPVDGGTAKGWEALGVSPGLTGGPRA